MNNWFIVQSYFSFFCHTAIQHYRFMDNFFSGPMKQFAMPENQTTNVIMLDYV